MCFGRGTNCTGTACLFLKKPPYWLFTLSGSHSLFRLMKIDQIEPEFGKVLQQFLSTRLEYAYLNLLNAFTLSQSKGEQDVLWVRLTQSTNDCEMKAKYCSKIFFYKLCFFSKDKIFLVSQSDYKKIFLSRGLIVPGVDCHMAFCTFHKTKYLK